MRSITSRAAALAAAGAFILAATALQAQTAPTTSATDTESTNSAVTNTNAAPKTQAAKAQLPGNTRVAQADTNAPTNTRVAQANGQAQTTTAAAAAAGAEELSEVVVTGSRVIKNGNDSPTPVTVVPVQDMLEVNPSGTIADQLNTLPQFAGSRGPVTNPSGGNQGNSSAASNPEANTLNLRNMGYTRTLILFDGHRVAPTGTDGTVDIDMIPQMLIQRIDIVTGGAGAVYGSDAVTGVVNFITDTHFNGLKVQGSQGISHYKDDETSDFGFAGGTNLFDGKGHIEGSFQTHNSAGVHNRSDRPFGRNLVTCENPSNDAQTYYCGDAVHTSNNSYGGLITGTSSLAGMEFSTNGGLTPFNYGTPFPGPVLPAGTPAGSQIGGGGTYGDATLESPLTMNQIYTRLDYDFTDSIHGYAYIAGNYTHTWAQAGNTGLGVTSTVANKGATISSSDPFLPAATQATLLKAGATFTFEKTFCDTCAPPSNVDTWERQAQADIGVNVKLPGGYEWDTFYSHGQNGENVRQNTDVNSLRTDAALNAAINPANGQIVCAVSLTANAGLYPGCVPLNPFGPTSASQAALNYIIQSTEFWAHTHMDDATTSLEGAPVSTWAGPVNMALSAEWRSLSYDLTQYPFGPNDQNNEISCAGLTFNCTVTNSAQVYGNTSADRSVVSSNVGEGAFEFDLPLLKNVFLAKNFDVSGAARWTEYNTSGPAWTWKGGFVWHIDDELTFRATRSRDIRAPTLNDLFLPASTGSSGAADPLTQVTPINPIPFISRGNPKLVPEIGNTSTGGIVYQPKWLKGFSVSLDAFKIDITNAIVAIRGASNTTLLGCVQSGGTSALCQTIVRPINCCSNVPANTYTTLYNEALNFAGQWTEGMDFEADYNSDINGHPFTLRALATWQPNLVYTAPGTPQYNLAGVGFYSGALQATPVWRASILARYSPFHDFTVDVFERWRSDLAWGPIYAPSSGDNLIIKNEQGGYLPKIEPVYYTDLTLSYLIEQSSHKTQVYASVTNLFNRQPPAGALFGQGGPGVFGGFAIGDDPIGAYYTVGFRFSL